MSLTRIARRIGTVATGMTAAVTLAAAPASAAPAPALYSYDACPSVQSAYSFTAHTCYIGTSFVHNGHWTVELGAYDKVKDGASARNYLYVQQWGPTVGWKPAQLVSMLTNSSGAGTTRIGNPVTFYHQAGTTYFRVTEWACAYDTTRDQLFDGNYTDQVFAW